MSTAVSVGVMIKKLDGLRGTADITPWQTDFITSVVAWSKNGTETTRLTGRQLEVVEQIYQRHFA